MTSHEEVRGQVIVYLHGIMHLAEQVESNIKRRADVQSSDDTVLPPSRSCFDITYFATQV